jgi:hypothetical protein
VKPVISDAEVRKFRDDCLDAAFNSARLTPEQCDKGVREALSAFLLARMPEEAGEYDIDGRGFNACREQVLRGRGDKA